MTKKILFSLMLFALMSFQVVNAQICNPDLSITTPGIFPDSATGLPCAIVDSLYSKVITAVVPLDTTTMVGGFPVDFWIDSIVLLDITGLPPGIVVDGCNPSSCGFPGGTSGCVKIKGTPTTVGLYNLEVFTRAYVRDKQFNTNNTQDDTISYYFIDVTDTANCILTGIKEIDASKLSVIQNNPNPFTDKTEISFTTAKTGIIKFKVYNVLGKLVYSENINAKTGANTIEFFTHDLPAGIYLYDLRDDKQRVVRKMVINGK